MNYLVINARREISIGDSIIHKNLIYIFVADNVLYSAALIRNGYSIAKNKL